VTAARARARARGVGSNVELGSAELDDLSRLDRSARSLVERALDAGRLTGRGLSRVRAVALTLDDLRGGDGTLDHEVMSEALALRAELDFMHHAGSLR
jgi:magnesium chelatase family protein